MRVIKRRAWPWFLLAGLLSAVGVIVLDGAAGGLVCFAAVVVLIGACLRGLASSDPDAVKRAEFGGFVGGGG